MSWLQETKGTGQPRAEWGLGRHSPRQMLSKALLEQLEKFAQRRCGSPASPAASEPQEAPGPEGMLGISGFSPGGGWAWDRSCQFGDSALPALGLCPSSQKASRLKHKHNKRQQRSWDPRAELPTPSPLKAVPLTSLCASSCPLVGAPAWAGARSHPGWGRVCLSLRQAMPPACSCPPGDRVVAPLGASSSRGRGRVPSPGHGYGGQARQARGPLGRHGVQRLLPASGTRHSQGPTPHSPCRC